MDRLNLKSSAFIALTVLTLPSPSFAAGGAAFHVYWANFSVFMILLFLLTRKPLLAFWAQRRAEIEDKVTKGQRDLEAAEERLRLIQQERAELPAVIDTLVATIKTETSNEISIIDGDTDKQIERIKTQVAANIAAEKSNAEKTIQAEIVEAALRKAEEKLRSEIGVDADRSNRDQAVGEMKQLFQDL